MQSSSYWQRFALSRLSRRRAIASTGAGVLGAAFLAACGGGDSGGGEKAPVTTSSLLHTSVDSTSQAKSGGTLKHFFTADLTHADALLSNSSSTVNQISVFAYPRMLKFTSVLAPKLNSGDQVEGELAGSYETSPDKLTITFKLREGLKWDSRAPTSGRVIDTSDVLYSWKKFAAVNASAVNLAYDATRSPGAAIESVTAPDAKTVVMKLKAPDAALLTLLAGWDQWYIMPKEADGGFDPKTIVRGHGPWMLEEYRPSAFLNWVKNPDYYVKNRPFPDRLEMPLVTEYAARLAQFKAGNIHTDVVLASQQDVVQLKRDIPGTAVLQNPTFSPVSSPNIYFGYEGNSPFKDVRVRQAMSMALDREAYADAIENRPGFEKDGLPIEVAFNSVLSAGWPGYWMDPKDSKTFGDSAKYLQFNAAEAKKLLTAAGHPNGVEFDFFFNRENTYGATYARTVEIYAAMFADVGLKAKLQGQPYALWLANWHYGYLPKDFEAGKVKGFNGIGLAAERTRYTPAISLYGLMHPEGDAFHGATTDGNNAVKGDPKLTADLAKLRQETDREKAIALTRDVIRYATQNAYYVPKPSNAKFFTVWWPAIGNLGSFNSSTVGANIWAETRINWW
ncbi:MAG TPA: ABC transporter substrate-binding protein, partial [Dehalococcoidia bacterium]|nr:ABC transporter substrate-binding protein [Dehalococcoidia bacterium]